MLCDWLLDLFLSGGMLVFWWLLCVSYFAGLVSVLFGLYLFGRLVGFTVYCG